MKWKDWLGWSLCKKCPNTEFFLVCIFLYSVTNARKYELEKTLYLDVGKRRKLTQKAKYNNKLN